MNAFQNLFCGKLKVMRVSAGSQGPLPLISDWDIVNLFHLSYTNLGTSGTNDHLVLMKESKDQTIKCPVRLGSLNN